MILRATELIATLALGILAAPLAADAQYTAGRLPRIGLLALSAAPVYAPDLHGPRPTRSTWVQPA